MPIHNPRAPRKHGRALRRFLLDVLTSRSGSAFLGWKYESAPASTEPHAVYMVGRDDVADGVLLERARLVSWRSLVKQEEGDVHAVEVAHPEQEDDEPQVLGLTRGRFGQATLDAVSAAEAFEAAQGRDYELRLLKIPALYFVAVWLHGEDDVLLPLEDHRGGLKANQPLAPAEVLAALQPLARAARETELDEAN